MGIWGPAKERVYDPKKDEIYEGPDRAAMDVLREENVESLGMAVEGDPQLLEVAQRYHMTVPEYLQRFKPSVKQVAQTEEAAKVVQDHKEPPKKRGVQPRGGGVTIRGGFGDMP
jgi:outer membrane biosynthesis protein TonB